MNNVVIDKLSIPRLCLGAVRLPIIGNRSEQAGDGILKDLKSHMLAWYDVKRQGCTNDSLAENPVLKNLSNRKVYSYDFNDIILAAGVTKASDYKALIPAQSLSAARNVIFKGVNVGDSFPAYSVRISGLQEGNIIELPTGSGLATKDGVYNIVKHTYTENEDLRYRYVLRTGDYNNLTIEILPLTLDLQLHNFEFGGLSGIGSYGTDLTKWTAGSVTIESVNRTSTKATVKFKDDVDRNTFNEFRIEKTTVGRVFKCKVNVPCRIAYTVLGNDTTYIAVPDNNNIEIYVPNARWLWVIPLDENTKQYTIEILPSFPNSLVFNGVAPTWVYDKANLTILDAKNFWINNNTLIVTNTDDYIIEKVYDDRYKMPSVIPSYKIRISGLQGLQSVSLFRRFEYSNSPNTFGIYLNHVGNGTYIVKEWTNNITDYSLSKLTDCQILINNDSNITNSNIKIEFLPDYAAPTTKMYGDIPDIPLNTVKCMMMDFTPFADKADQWYYTQRHSLNNPMMFAIVNAVSAELEDTSKILAYSIRNTLGTYINGTINTNKTVLSLLQKRQIAAVNVQNPNYNFICICAESTNSKVAQMALNSLILFDRELTGEEMAYIIEKLMCKDLVSHEEYELNMTDTNYFMLYLDFAYQLPADVTAYTGEITGNDTLLTHKVSGNIIPANTGVLVKTTTPGIKVFKQTYLKTSVMPANNLQGVIKDTSLTDISRPNSKVLTLDVDEDGNIGIYPPTSSYIRANQCYFYLMSFTPDDRAPVTSGDAG